MAIDHGGHGLLRLYNGSLIKGNLNIPHSQHYLIYILPIHGYFILFIVLIKEKQFLKDNVSIFK